MSGHGLRVSDIAPVGERAGDHYRGRVGTNVAGVDSQLGIQMVGTLADGQGWVYDAASNTLIPGDVGPGIDLQDDGVSQVNPATVLNARHALSADASGNLDVVESELDGSLIPGSPLYKRLTDYGAVPDDTTISTTEIQAALDACTAGDTLFVDGQFAIDAALTWPVNIRLLGYGATPTWGELPSRIRMATANTTAISSIASSPDTAKVVLDHVELAGPGGGSSGRGIYSTSDVVLHSAIVRGFYDNVYVDDSVAYPTAFVTELLDSWIDGATRADIYLDTKVNNVTIQRNRLADCAYGILGTGGIFSGRIEANDIEVFSAIGVSIDGSGAGQSTKAIIIAGNYFEDAGTTATADIDLGATNTVYDALIEGNYHNPSASASLWHVNLHKTDHATMVGGFFGIGTEAGAIQGHSTNTVDLVLVNPGLHGATISVGASTTVLERTLVTPQSVGGANAAGTSPWLARADHVHDGSGSAPTTADYLVGTSQAGLSAEIVVGTSPGGELGGTWASPTVDATHSGSAHVTALDGLSDVVITTPASGDRLRYDGSNFVNSALRSEPHVAYDGTVVLDGNGDPVMVEQV